MSGGHNTQQQTTYDPKIMALLQSNYGRALGIANAPVTPYTGELSAGLSPEQLQAGGLLGGIAAHNPGESAVNGGILGATQAMSFAPPEIASYDVTPGMLRDVNLEPYFSPFTQAVIDRTVRDNERARQIAQVSNDQQATSAKAFGGSRSGVLGALTNEAWDRNTLSALAGLRQGAFENAQNAALGDINRRLSADQFNAGNRISAAQTNAANTLAANAQHLQGAGLLGELGRGQFSDALAAAQAYQGYGAQVQATQQARDAAAYQEFLRQQQDPFVKQQLLNAALGIIPIPTTSTTHQSGSFLGGLLNGIGSVAGLFGV